MKKIILISMLVIIGLASRQTLNAQITLLNTYDSAFANLYIVNLEVEGQKYVLRDYANNQIKLYNLDYSLFKIMPLPNNLTYSANEASILYISEHLFNTDDSIEYMFCFNYNQYHTFIVSETGYVIFYADSAYPLVQGAFPEQQFPIYNTPNGTRMILSFNHGTTGYANIYGLGGTLTSSIQPIGNPIGNQLMENIYPNPSNGNTTIEFNLPQGVNTGQLVIYNNQGVELKMYNVDNTFHTLLLNNSEFHAGTYFYQLVTSSGATGAKKMVVIKE